MHSPLIEILESRIAPAAALSINNVNLAEGNAATQTMHFTVTLSEAVATDVTLDWTTADGTATGADSDYVPGASSLTIPANTLTGTIDVTINGDTNLEQNEQFFVNIGHAVGATVANGHGIGTILNDDAPNISINDISIVEGDTGTKNATFTVSLSGPTTQSVSVDWATADGTATAGTDYTASNNTVTIAAGAVSGTFTVPIVNDTVKEMNEDFFVNLTNPTNGNLLDAQGKATILDNDGGGTLVNSKTVTFTDVDGDLVTVKTSRGAFDLAKNFLLVRVSDLERYQLQILDVGTAINGTTFQGANLTFTAVPTGLNGDGHVNIGFLSAPGIDLGTVKIPGDLGSIVVGDALKTTGIRALNIDSFGVLGSATGAPSLVSTITGPAGTINVAGDVQNVTLNVQGSGGIVNSGSIAMLHIGGGLIGGAAGGSGLIHFSGTLANATIGSIEGGAGADSGELLGDYATLGTITRLTVLGDVIGGDGTNSGQISATKISSVTIKGDLQGGDGAFSGLIQSPVIGNAVINGSLIGGAGFHSGEIFAQSITTVKIGQDLQGGTAGSNPVAADPNALPPTSGSPGFTGFSGVIEANKIGSITIGGSMKGGDFVDATHTAGDSGSIYADNINAISIAHNLQGGTGNGSGIIIVNQTLKSLKIGENFVGGSSGATKLINSGYVQAGHLGTVFIGGDMIAGTAGAGGIDTSGAIRSTHEIGAVTIKGNMTGNPTNSAIISAVGQSNLAATAKTDLAIKSISIGKTMTRAEILAGYGTDTTNSLRGERLNADASVGPVTVGIDMIASNIVAGVSAGANGFFGDSDDAKISGAGTTDRAGIISKISSVIIKGIGGIGSGGTAANDAENFGIVAQNVALVRANGVLLPLTAGPGNALAPGVAIGSTPGTGTTDGKDFHAMEVV